MMQSFIDEFLAENCRGEELLAERLKHFCALRQLALMAASGVCRNSLWPYDPNATDRAAVELPEGTCDDARQRRIIQSTRLSMVCCTRRT